MDWVKSNWHNYLDSQETLKWSGKYMNSGVMTSADETKLFRVIKTRTDCAELQWTLVKKWEKEYNTDRCKKWANAEKCWCYRSWLWNYVNCDYSVEMSDQCYVMIKKAKQISGIIRKEIEKRTENTIMLQYTSIVYPHLQHCLWFWSLCLKKNVSELGKCQKKTTGLSWTYGPLLETGDWIWWTLVTMTILMFKNSYKLNCCSVSQKWSLGRDVSLPGKKNQESNSLLWNMRLF